jgi:putative DNA primase/helicase
MSTDLDMVAAFRGAMAEVGISTAAPIIPDGTLHRVHVDGDRRGSHNGWFVLHLDPPVSGAFGSWKLGVTHLWTAAARDRLTSAELTEIRRRADEARAARQHEEANRHEAARVRARSIWCDSLPADPEHSYLQAKRITPGTARQRGVLLVLSVADLNGRLWSLQFIGPDGGKKLLAGGRKRGHCKTNNIKTPDWHMASSVA